MRKLIFLGEYPRPNDDDYVPRVRFEGDDLEFIPKGGDGVSFLGPRRVPADHRAFVFLLRLATRGSQGLTASELVGRRGWLSDKNPYADLTRFLYGRGKLGEPPATSIVEEDRRCVRLKSDVEVIFEPPPLREALIAWAEAPLRTQGPAEQKRAPSALLSREPANAADTRGAVISMDEFRDALSRLCEGIRRTKKTYDVVFACCRSGAIAAGMVANELKHPTLVVVDRRRRDGSGTAAARGYELGERIGFRKGSWKGLNVLVVFLVENTGESVREAKQYLAARGVDRRRMTAAVLYVTRGVASRGGVLFGSQVPDGRAVLSRLPWLLGRYDFAMDSPDGESA